MISHHPTSCSAAVELRRSSPSTSSFFPHPSPPCFLASHIHLHSLPCVFSPWQPLTFSFGDGTKLGSPFPFLLLLVSGILRLSRHHAKALLSPPHHPTMKSPFISFFFSPFPAQLSLILASFTFLTFYSFHLYLFKICVCLKQVLTNIIWLGLHNHTSYFFVFSYIGHIYIL